MDEKQDQVATKETQTSIDQASADSVSQDTPQQKQTTNENEHQPAQVAVETQEQINYRALRELKEKAERERDDLLNRFKQMEQLQKQQPSTPQTQPEQDYSVAPDDLVEGKHLSAVDKKVKQLEDQLKTYQQQSATQNIEVKLKAQYPDFDKVVSKENIEIFRTAYPELATAIGSSTDLYSQATSAYTLIKKFGIDKHQSTSQNVDRVHQNLSKPVPTASLGTQQGESPLTKANAFAEGLTPDIKKQLYREMLEAEKNV